MVTKIMEWVSITAFLLVVSWRPVASYLIPLDFVVCVGFVMGVLALFFIKREIETHYEVDNRSNPARRVTASVSVLSANENAVETLMPDTIKTGTILIKDGTLLPESLRFESEPCVPGWRLVTDLDGYGLDRKIREAGWTFFCLAGQLGATVSGIDEQKTLSRAVEQILASPESAEFNSLEIMRVASEASKRFLGVCYVTVSAQSRHIQDSAFLFQAKVLLVRDRARSAAA